MAKTQKKKIVAIMFTSLVDYQKLSKKDSKLALEILSEHDKILLKNINLNIHKNNKIGIIGPSGSGKSTLIDIICGFQRLNYGVVESDGKSILSNLEGWQKNIGYIPQDIVILNQSLKENILFGASPKHFNDKKIIREVAGYFTITTPSPPCPMVI